MSERAKLNEELGILQMVFEPFHATRDDLPDCLWRVEVLQPGSATNNVQAASWVDSEEKVSRHIEFVKQFGGRVLSVTKWQKVEASP